MMSRYDPCQEQYRIGFIAYLQHFYSEKNTINSYVNKVFFLWNKRGESLFWSAVFSDDESLRAILKETLEKYTQNCAKEAYLKDHLRCFRKFQEYVSEHPEYPR